MSLRAVSIAVVALFLAAVVGPVATSTSTQAKSYRSHAHAFRTGTCKTSSCRAKHPGGRYVYPLRSKRHR